MRKRWRALRALPRHERLLLLKALVMLPASAAALRIGGLRRVQAVLAHRAARRRPSTQTPAGLDEARRAAHLVDVAARRGLWNANCLQRSVTLRWILLSEGIDTDLRIGVRRAGTPARFHAWLEQDGSILNDRADVGDRYAAFEGNFSLRRGKFE